MILDKYYKYLSSRVIGFSKVTSIQILTHLITKYAELEDNDIQEIYRKMEETISGETIFEEFIEKIEWNQEAFVVKNPYTPAQIVSMVYANIKNAGYIKIILDNGIGNQGSRKPGATIRLTFIKPSRIPKYHQGPRRLKDMQQTSTPHKSMRHFSSRFSRTTLWRWLILQRQHKPT